MTELLTVDTEMALSPYRDAFAQMAIGSVVVRDGLTDDVAQAIRERLEAKSFAEYRMAHQGHFSYLDDIAEPELLSGLVNLAEFVTETRLAVASQRCFRLTAGDYVLSSAVAESFGFEVGGRMVDVIVDLSEASSGEAQVVYALKGEHFFAAPQLRRSITVIERRPSVTRYHRYLNHKMEGRIVYRHCVTLRRTDVPATDPPASSLLSSS